MHLSAMSSICVHLDDPLESSSTFCLQELSASKAYAIRDGSWQDVPSKELVPGDIIELKGGNVIPAD